MKRALILRKLTVLFMIVAVSFAIKYTLEKDDFKVNRTEGIQNVYIQLNDSKYIRHPIHSNDVITLKVKENDAINLIMLENTTITYKWVPTSLDIFDEASSLLLVSEEKISSSTFNPFQVISDGAIHDQKQFTFKINTTEDSKINFSYVNARDTSQSSFNFTLLLDASN